MIVAALYILSQLNFQLLNTSNLSILCSFIFDYAEHAKCTQGYSVVNIKAYLESAYQCLLFCL